MVFDHNFRFIYRTTEVLLSASHLHTLSNYTTRFKLLSRIIFKMPMNGTQSRYRANRKCRVASSRGFKEQPNETETPNDLTGSGSRNAVVLHKTTQPENAESRRKEDVNNDGIPHENHSQSPISSATEEIPSQPAREMYQALLEQRGVLRVTNGDACESEHSSESDGDDFLGDTISSEWEYIGRNELSNIVSVPAPNDALSEMAPLRRMTLPFNSTHIYPAPKIYYSEYESASSPTDHPAPTVHESGARKL
ncbi:hypothetical protein DM02DRAFT_708506 [Periconia macrospinosa]|uniref:Uncharacterized protein n=1 Tax=Periconia macrospinosa TaxID=97972 RepID=A0A2V1DQN1_9PLEO|nr:hypothetical protein DM02DRAFT_708506 [Periconia macrospinosa]